ncbi:NLP/P60 family protein [Buttiauxella noackiae ATCC 51607]|uniref:NLP/P60 family protein n=1 Tax=Buttiauxella noackiae ATCC 51607 TaxID=1354255 RepID=A0A1B7HGX5_9ENTR|nr:NlpC/P60 family protein [Buttiauxella noackiae]OAT14896.1 NLP/P60 family protein [Buttiauxella noackiae ATCC 51607]
MYLFKKIVTASLLIIPLVISANSFAFNMPKEFASLGVNALSHKDVFSKQASLINPERKINSNNIRATILAEFSNWKGTRYHFGGTTHKGVDCSALMQHIFSDSFHKSLPRTTTQQIRNGEHVNKEMLKPGDLVFFQTSPGTRHVGVYVGNNEFIHASSSVGVTISSLANRYWMDHYETARRLKMIG